MWCMEKAQQLFLHQLLVTYILIFTYSTLQLQPYYENINLCVSDAQLHLYSLQTLFFGCLLFPRFKMRYSSYSKSSEMTAGANIHALESISRIESFSQSTQKGFCLLNHFGVQLFLKRTVTLCDVLFKCSSKTQRTFLQLSDEQRWCMTVMIKGVVFFLCVT